MSLLTTLLTGRPDGVRARLRRRLGDAAPAATPASPAPIAHEAAEKALADALAGVKPQADQLFEQHDYAGSLKALAALKAPVDAFFDDVMVNAEDAALRANRQALLKQLHEAMNRVADLSRLAV